MQARPKAYISRHPRARGARACARGLVVTCATTVNPARPLQHCHVSGSRRVRVYAYASRHATRTSRKRNAQHQIQNAYPGATGAGRSPRASVARPHADTQLFDANSILILAAIQRLRPRIHGGDSGVTHNLSDADPVRGPQRAAKQRDVCGDPPSLARCSRRACQGFITYSPGWSRR